MALLALSWLDLPVDRVASRLADRRHRPSIVLSTGPEESRASARSIPAFDIVAAIRKVAGG